MLIDSIINSFFNIDNYLNIDILITWAFVLEHTFDANFDYKSHPIMANRKTL